MATPIVNLVSVMLKDQLALPVRMANVLASLTLLVTNVTKLNQDTMISQIQKVRYT